MRSGALGMCRNAFFDLTPAPALAVYTPRRILSSRGGLGRLRLEREDLRRVRPAVLQKVARELLLVFLLKDAIEGGGGAGVKSAM